MSFEGDVKGQKPLALGRANDAYVHHCLEVGVSHTELVWKKVVQEKIVGPLVRI